MCVDFVDKYPTVLHFDRGEMADAFHAIGVLWDSGYYETHSSNLKYRLRTIRFSECVSYYPLSHNTPNYPGLYNSAVCVVAAQNCWTIVCSLGHRLTCL